MWCPSEDLYVVMETFPAYVLVNTGKALLISMGKGRHQTWVPLGAIRSFEMTAEGGKRAVITMERRYARSFGFYPTPKPPASALDSTRTAP